MSLNIQTATGLLEIGGSVTKEKVISALEYEPANKEVETTVDTHIKDANIHITSAERTTWNKNIENLDAHKTDKTVHVTSTEKEIWNNKSDFSGAYADLLDAPNITENDSDNVVIADRNGNIIMQVDANGVSTTNVNTKTVKLNGKDLGEKLDELEAMSLPNILDNESDNLSIADQAGNVIVKIDANGLETTTVTTNDIIIGGKNIIETIDTHTSDKKVHVTETEKDAWNKKSDFSGFYADLPDAPNIQENNSGEVVYADESGNVIAKINENGFETTQVIANTVIANGVNVEEKIAQVNERIDNISIPSIEGLATETYVDEAVAALVNSAPDKLNTLDELAAALGDDENFASTVTNSLAEKAKQTDLNTHTSDKVIHVTADERTAWNAKSNFSGDYNDLTNAPSIQENSSGEVIYADEVGNIIAKINENGFETTTVTAKNVVVNGTDVETALGGKAASDHTHSQYLVANDIAGKADKTYVDTEISAAIVVAESDATNKDVVVLAEAQRGIEAVQNALDTHTHTELHSHSNKAELDKIVEGKVEYWDAKSDFSGNYADLVDAPDIKEDDTNSLVIADRAGNIIFRSDGAGFETTTLTAQNIILNGSDFNELIASFSSTIIALQAKITELETALANKQDKIYTWADLAVGAGTNVVNVAEDGV